MRNYRCIIIALLAIILSKSDYVKGQQGYNFQEDPIDERSSSFPFSQLPVRRIYYQDEDDSDAVLPSRVNKPPPPRENFSSRQGLPFPGSSPNDKSCPLEEELQVNLKKQTAELKVQERKYRTLVSELTILNEKIDELENQLNDRERALLEQDSKIGDQGQILDEREKELEQINNSILKQRQQIEEKDELLIQRSLEIRTLETRVETLTIEIRTLTGKIKSLEDLLQEQKDLLAERDAAFRKQQETITFLEEEIRSLRMRNAQGVELAEKIVAVIKKERELAKQQLEASKGEEIVIKRTQKIISSGGEAVATGVGLGKSGSVSQSSRSESSSSKTSVGGSGAGDLEGGNKSKSSGRSSSSSSSFSSSSRSSGSASGRKRAVSGVGRSFASRNWRTN